MCLRPIYNFYLHAIPTKQFEADSQRYTSKWPVRVIRKNSHPSYILRLSPWLDEAHYSKMSCKFLLSSFLYRVKWVESFPNAVTIYFRPWVGHLFKAWHIFLAHSQFSLFALFQIATQNIFLHIKRLQVLPALYITVNSNQPRALIYKPTWGIILSSTSHPPLLTFSNFPFIYFALSPNILFVTICI